MDVIITIGVLLLLAGVAVLCAGVWGRVVGQRPHCARCAFELTGLGAIPIGVARACPECGGCLSPAWAVRWGRRDRSGHAVHGLLLVVAGVVVAAPPLTLAAIGRLSPAQQPSWYLVLGAQASAGGGRVLGGAVGALSFAQLQEAVARATGGALSPRQQRALEVSALVVQGRADEWSPEMAQTWGALLDRAHDRGALTGAELERYARQAVPDAQLLLAEAADATGAVPVTLETDPARTGVAPRLSYERTLVALRAGGREATLQVSEGARMQARATRWTTPVAADALCALADARDDGADVYAGVLVVVRDSSSGATLARRTFITRPTRAAINGVIVRTVQDAAR